MSDFEKTVAERVVVADGATGSLLAAHFRGEPPSVLARQILGVNLKDPELVHDIHLQYLSAGAELIETNTFGANRPRLEKLGLDLNVVSDAVKIARSARDASGRPAWVAGSVSPLDGDWLLEENPSPEEQTRVFAELVDVLIDRGVDLIILETFSSLAEMLTATKAVRQVSASIPFVAQMTFDEPGFVNSGESAADVAKVLSAEGACAVGINCGMGPQSSLGVLRMMSEAGAPVLSIMPNAGFAQRLGDRVIYPDMSAATYGAFALQARAMGARIVGGCCGTTPAQIRAIAASLSEPQGRRPSAGSEAAHAQARVRIAAEALPSEAPDDAPSPDLAGKGSQLAQNLAAGRFVWSLQIDPQRGPFDQANREVVKAVLAEGTVDLIDINSSGQGSRQDALQIAAGIERLGIETLAHITPRDATVAGVLSQVIGAHDWGGINNVLVITGDPPRGDFVAEAKGVFQVDSIGLVRALDRLRHGLAAGGRATIPPFQLVIGVAFNQNAPDFDAELDRLDEKIAAGADFVMTQPFFAIEEWRPFFKRVSKRRSIPILAGAWPLLSQRQAIRINENVSGIVVSETIFEKLASAGAHEKEKGFELAREFCQELEADGEAAGVYVVAPFKQPRQALELFRSRKPR